MAESGTPRVAVPLATRDAAVSVTAGGVVADAPAVDVIAPLAVAVALRPDVAPPDAPAEWRSPQAMRSEPSPKVVNRRAVFTFDHYCIVCAASSRPTGIWRRTQPRAIC